MKFALGLVVAAGIGIGLGLPAAKPAPRIASAPPPLWLRGLSGCALPPLTRETARPTGVERAASGHFLAVAEVNQQPIRFIVDTGADTVALTLDDARTAGVPFDPSQFEVIGKGAAGYIRGQEVRIAELVLDGKRATDVRAVVMADSDVSLLGQTYLRQVDTVRIKGDTMTLE